MLPNNYYTNVITYIDQNFKEKLVKMYQEKRDKYGPGVVNIEVHDMTCNNFKSGYLTLESLIDMNQKYDNLLKNVEEKVSSNKDNNNVYISIMIDRYTFILEYIDAYTRITEIVDNEEVEEVGSGACIKDKDCDAGNTVVPNITVDDLD